MSIKGVIVDENVQVIRKAGRIYSQIDLGNGEIKNHFVEEELVQINSEAVAGGSASDSNRAGSSRLPNDLSENKDKEFHWTNPMVKLLIDTYRNVKEDGGQKIKLQKHLWNKIAQKISGQGYEVSGPQYGNKWKGLLKMYKKYKDRENTTGEAGGVVWDHFDTTDEILYNKPAISPVAISSNLKCYRLEIAKRVQKKTNSEDSDENAPPNFQQLQVPLENGEPSVKRSKKSSKEGLDTSRRSPMNRLCLSIEKRHEAQQALQERFVSTFEKYVEFVQSKYGGSSGN